MFIQKKVSAIKYAFVLVVFFSGCSANHYSIYRTKTLDSDSSAVISVDAKQRLLLSNIASGTTTTEKIRRY